MEYIEVSSDLLPKVLHAIARARARRLRQRFLFVVSGLIVSFGYVLINWQALWQEVQASSFFEFARFVQSDPDIVLGSLKELALGLVETLPLGAVLVGLVSVFFLIGSAALSIDVLRLRRHMYPVFYIKTYV